MTISYHPYHHNIKNNDKNNEINLKLHLDCTCQERQLCCTSFHLKWKLRVWKKDWETKVSILQVIPLLRRYSVFYQVTLIINFLFVLLFHVTQKSRGYSLKYFLNRSKTSLSIVKQNLKLFNKSSLQILVKTYTSFLFFIFYIYIYIYLDFWLNL